MTQPNVVTVRIGGEEYSLRTHASPEYTHECAEYVDETVSRILGQASIVEPHRAILLAALSLADQLFEARASTEALRAEIARLAGKLAADVEATLQASDLASSA